MSVSSKFTQIQQIKFDLFKEQNLEIGRYDVTFEVEGKILYAHKNMLNLISDTFDAMLSDRWAKKDVPIKIQSCSYDNFYQFLTYLYSAQCQLNEANIYAMVDLAEFYGVNLFKTYCDEYLAAVKVTTGNVFKLLDLTEKYSMNQLKATIHAFVTNNFQAFVNSDGFLIVSKSVLKKLFVVVKDIINHEELFLAIYKWVEDQALVKQIDDLNVNLNDLIKSEISPFLPYFQFDKMEMYFLLESVVPHGFIFPSLSNLSKILCNRYPKTKVKITNSNEQTLYGSLIPDKSVIQYLKSLSFASRTGYSDGQCGCYWQIYVSHPSTPSLVKDIFKCYWYLVLDESRILRVMRGKAYLGMCYVLAQLEAEKGQGWVGTHNTTLEVYQDF